MEMFKDHVDVNAVFEDAELRPYFLDLVGKSFLNSLNGKYNDHYFSKVKAQKEFYDSLFRVVEKLRLVVPPDQLQSTIEEVSFTYIQNVKPTV